MFHWKWDDETCVLLLTDTHKMRAKQAICW